MNTTPEKVDAPAPAEAPGTKKENLKKGKPQARLKAGGKVEAIVPHTIEQVYRFADAVITACLAPDSFENDRNKVAMAILKGLEVGLMPMTALANIYIVKARPTIWGDAAMALVHDTGELEFMNDHYEGSFEKGDLMCSVTMKRRTVDNSITRTFSMADATHAGLINRDGTPKAGKFAWNYINRMLFNRARAWCVRDLFADVLCGLAIREELEGIPEKKTVKDTKFLGDVIEGEANEIPAGDAETKTSEGDTWVSPEPEKDLIEEVLEDDELPEKRG